MFSVCNLCNKLAIYDRSMCHCEVTLCVTRRFSAISNYVSCKAVLWYISMLCCL